MPILITGLANDDSQHNDAKARAKARRQKMKQLEQQLQQQHDDGRPAATTLLSQSSSDDLLHQPDKRREARGEDTSQGYLCSLDGFNEIFNMRMYKVPRPSVPPSGQEPQSGDTPTGATGAPASPGKEGTAAALGTAHGTTHITSHHHTVRTKNILIGGSYHLDEKSANGNKKNRAKDNNNQGGSKADSAAGKAVEDARKLAELVHRLQTLKSNPGKQSHDVSK
jgi:hypothetical protein